MNTRLTLTAGAVVLAAAAALWRYAGPHAPALDTASFASAAGPNVAANAVLPNPAAPTSTFNGAETLAPRHAPARAARSPAVVVYVAGEVVRPGVYALPPGSRGEAAVRAAGGMKLTADAVAVNLAAPLADGEEIAVPALGAPSTLLPTAKTGQASHRLSRRHKGRSRKHAPAAPLDLNAVDAATLATLPGIGAGLGERIVAYRNLNGPFGSVDDLQDVGGMTEARLTKIAPYLSVR